MCLLPAAIYAVGMMAILNQEELEARKAGREFGEEAACKLWFWGTLVFFVVGILVR